MNSILISENDFGHLKLADMNLRSSIPHFGERLRVLLNQRLTGIYRLTNVLLQTENDFFS